MEDKAPEVTCRFCLTYNRLDRVFCLNCSKRLLPSPINGLSADDFTSPDDRSNLDALKGTEPLPHLIEKFVAPGGVRSESWLSRYSVRIRPPSRLDTLIRACSEILGLESLPRGYVAPINQMNAFSAGRDDDPLLVICSPVLEKLDYVGVEGLVAHELAHVKSKHVLYHTLAESIAAGAQVVIPMLAAGLMTMPIRMLLLSWYRESEISADRAALLVLGRYHLFESMMTGLTGSSVSDGRSAETRSSIAELLQTHPGFERRLRLAQEYRRSAEYGNAREKLIITAASSALASICRYCGVVVPRTESFCPACGLGRA